ncbi:MAG: hypothetical protein J2P49_11580 [Methylocapsa sp.]|nr:hypothetical protein [Methylocapsa sp.]
MFELFDQRIRQGPEPALAAGAACAERAGLLDGGRIKPASQLVCYRQFASAGLNRRR